MRKPHGSIHIQIGEEENLRLFATYKEIEPEPEKSLRVAETLERRLGPEAYVEICCALYLPVFIINHKVIQWKPVRKMRH